MTTKSHRAIRRKLAVSTETGERTLPARLYELRKALGCSQEALGAQGFVSTPGWIKIENGQRSASEELLGKFCDFLVAEKVVRATEKQALYQELCALKYCGHRREFMRLLANGYLRGLTPVVIQTPPRK